MKVIQNPGGLQTLIGVQDGALVTGSRQDCTPIAEFTKAVHNTGYQGPSGEMKWAARVPDVMIEAYCNRVGITLAEFTRSQEHKKRLLGDPALADFRIWKGQV